MKLTNRLGLPEAIVEAIRHDGYTRGECDLSVTQLIAPPRQVELRRLHEHEIEEDAADRIWLLMGKIAHGILEKSTPSGSAFSEERLFMDVLGWRVSGAFDQLAVSSYGAKISAESERERDRVLGVPGVSEPRRLRVGELQGAGAGCPPSGLDGAGGHDSQGDVGAPSLRQPVVPQNRSPVSGDSGAEQCRPETEGEERGSARREAWSRGPDGSDGDRDTEQPPCADGGTGEKAGGVEASDLARTNRAGVGSSELWKLSDFKVTSVWSVIYADGKKEWEQQLNMYAHLLRLHSFDVSELEIVAICRDWQKSKAQREADYPQQQVAVLPQRLWTHEETQAFIEERVRLHQQARESLPLCSREDRWQRPDSWALMKKTAKRATKVYFDEAEANAAADGMSDYRVEHRPGVPTRCRSYCSVAPFCEQFRLEGGGDTDGQEEG